MLAPSLDGFARFVAVDQLDTIAIGTPLEVLPRRLLLLCKHCRCVYSPAHLEGRADQFERRAREARERLRQQRSDRGRGAIEYQRALLERGRRRGDEGSDP